MSHLIRVSSKVYLLPRSRQLLVPCQGIEQFQQKRNFSFKEQFVGFINALPEYYAATLNSGVVQSIAHGYGSIHDATGLPWWAVILGTSALFRISTLLPAQTTSRKAMNNRILLFEELEKKVIPRLRAHGLKMQQSKGWTDSYTQERFLKATSDIKKDMVIERNCALSKVILPFYIQFPAWISVSLGIRLLGEHSMIQNLKGVNLEASRYSELAQEGVLWIPDLIAPDPTLILPALVVLTFLANIELSVSRYSGHTSKWQGRFINIFRVFSLALGAVACFQPSALGLFWVSSGLTGFFTNLVLIHPGYRKLMKIPDVTSFDTNKKPYKFVWDNFVERKITFWMKITKNK